ncbi:hypothetical protein EPUS_04042 [Endocarpon pusillum Z07020]|uniref:Uncharacterized protein n=1 Tax=Endocarpon pusillum (strain Z07020 / HMAS-L-300199) TaxID=1263415 RepID=U1HVM3_ENDPU|nr:uncharacterized protein EPUS_04042 [Endocarpon pusillum Z07020]ERF73419.1 hypothetical protein EPUS_04042 [Endocarpon pusillum Z07020]
MGGRKGGRQRNGRPIDPVAPGINARPQQRHATTNVNRSGVPSEHRCPLSSLYASFTDPNSDTGATKPKVVYEKLSMPGSSMSLIVRKLGRRMDLDFALVEGTNDLQAESMFESVVKIRVMLPDDRYTISFRVYQPRLTMEILRYSRYRFRFDHYTRYAYRDGKPVWNMILTYLRASDSTEVAFANVPRPVLTTATMTLSQQVMANTEEAEGGNNSQDDNQENQDARIPPTRLRKSTIWERAQKPRPDEEDDDTIVVGQQPVEQTLIDEQIRYMTEGAQQFQLDELQYLELPVAAKVSKHPWALIGHWQDPEVLKLIRDFMGDREVSEFDEDLPGESDDEARIEDLDV